MDWYYAEGTKRVGPLDGRQMGQLAQQGKITPETLVWREGLPSWVAAKKVAPNLFLGVAPQPPKPAEAPPKPGAGASSVTLEPGSPLNLQINLVDTLGDLSGGQTSWAIWATSPDSGVWARWVKPRDLWPVRWSGKSSCVPPAAS